MTQVTRVLELIHPIISSLFVFCVSILAVISVCLIILPSDHKRVNIILSLTLLVCIVDGLYYGVYFSNPELALAYPWLYGFQSLSLFLIFPGFYLYLRKLLAISAPEEITIWPHFILFFVMLVALVPYIFTPVEIKTRILEDIFRQQRLSQITMDLPRHTIIFLAASHLIYLAMVATYLVKISSVYKQYIQSLSDVLSSLEEVKTRWVRGAIIFFVCYFFTTAISSALYFLGYTDPHIVLMIFLAANSLLYLYIALQGVFHPYVYTQSLRATLESITQKTKYQQSALSEEQKNQIKEKLIKHLETNKPYLSNSLTLRELAEQLGIRRSQTLSEVINQEMGESYYNLINRYRALEAKTQLDSGYDGSMVNLALSAGFSSVSTFNRQFKNLTQMTPKQYNSQQAQ